MADDTVQVVFGAKIDNLIEGVSSVRHAIEGVKESTDRVSEGAKAMLEAFGAGLSIEGIRRFIDGMGDLGDKIEKAAAITGTSIEQVINLGGVAKITGSSLEGMSESVSRMTLNIQRAANNALAPASQGLKVLGLNAKDLVGISADQVFLKLATAVEKFNPSLNVTNALMTIGGRNVAQMVPLLHLGAAGFAELQEKVKQAQAGLAEAVPGMANTNEKLGLLSLSIQSFAARLFTVLKPAIDAAVTWLTNFVQGIDANKMITAIMTVTRAVGEFAISTLKFLEEISGGWDRLASKVSMVAVGMATGGALGAAMGGVGVVPGALLGGATGAAINGIKEWYEGYNKAADEGNKTMAERQARLEAMLARMKQLMDQAVTPMPKEGEGGGAAAGAMDLNVGATIAAQAAAIEGQIKLLQMGLQRKIMIYNQELEVFSVTQGQRIGKVAQATDQEYALELALLEKERVLYGSMPKERAVIDARILELKSSHETAMLRLTQESVRSQLAMYQEFFGALQGAFNGQLRGLLAGTTSFRQAFKHVIGDMIIFFIQAIEKMVFNWIAGQLAMVTATTSAEAAKAGAVEAGALAQMAAQLPLILKNIAAAIGNVFAGVSAFLAPALGPAAPAAAASVAAGVEATSLAMVGSAEHGAWEVQGGQWNLHDKEMVLPAPAAQAFRDLAEKGGLGGGNQLHLHGQLIDGPSLARFARDNAGLLAQALRSFSAINPRRA